MYQIKCKPFEAKWIDEAERGHHIECSKALDQCIIYLTRSDNRLMLELVDVRNIGDVLPEQFDMVLICIIEESNEHVPQIGRFDCVLKYLDGRGWRLRNILVTSWTTVEVDVL